MSQKDPRFSNIGVKDDNAISSAEGTINVDGQSYCAKVIEFNDRVLLFYDVNVVSGLPTQSDKLNKLDQFLDDNGYSNTSKDIMYKAL